MVRELRARALLVARLRLVRVGMGMAGRRRSAPRLLREWRCVCRRSAPGYGRRRRGLFRCPGSGRRRGDIRRVGGHERHDGDHLLRGVQGVADALGSAPRPPGGARRRRGRRRRARAERGGRARDPLRPSRRPSRLRRRIRRSALTPSASRRPPASTCARGAARTTASRRARRNHVGEPGRPGGRSSPRADPPGRSAACRFPARPERYLDGDGGHDPELGHPDQASLAPDSATER